MAYTLPTQANPVRELIDLEHLASLTAADLPSLREAGEVARRTFAADRATRKAHVYTLRANGDLELIAYGPRGGRQVLWNFGPARIR